MVNKKLVTHAMLTFHVGQYKGVEVVGLYCGVCKVNAAIATQILIDKFEVTHVIVTGVAGAIDRTLKIGDTVISTKVAYHDVADDILTEYHPWMKSVYFSADLNLLKRCEELVASKALPNPLYFGKVVTGEAFISDKGRTEIISKFNPRCVDMETASIAHVCYVNSIPFIAIRYITDTEDESGVGVFEDNCMVASNQSLRVLMCLLESLNRQVCSENVK
ncbi:MAG: 5'-methylthioadenosine/S-adenosylhomocysteine nucleosidase [Turicibacter sp.]